MTLRTYILVGILIAATADAQVHSVQFYGNYSAALGKRIFVTKATSFGGGAEIRFKVGEIVMISLAGGYERYSIDQDSALARWNWRFWNERYSGIVRENLATNPALSATLTPVQFMEVVPILLTFGSEFPLADDVVVRPSLGGGAFFFTRSLFLDEEWRKRFDANNYTFEYRYQNFAGDKKGNPLVLILKLEVAYAFAEGFTIDGMVRYSHLLKTPGKFGFNEVPLSNALSAMLGISFLY